MLVGYARVSTQDQNLDMQRKALTEAVDAVSAGERAAAAAQAGADRRLPLALLLQEGTSNQLVVCGCRVELRGTT